MSVPAGEGHLGICHLPSRRHAPHEAGLLTEDEETLAGFEGQVGGAGLSVRGCEGHTHVRTPDRGGGLSTAPAPSGRLGPGHPRGRTGRGPAGPDVASGSEPQDPLPRRRAGPGRHPGCGSPAGTAGSWAPPVGAGQAGGVRPRGATGSGQGKGGGGGGENTRASPAAAPAQSRERKLGDPVETSRFRGRAAPLAPRLLSKTPATKTQPEPST